MENISKDTLREYLKLAIWVNQEIIESWGDPLEIFGGSISVLNKELKNPRLAQTRLIIKDLLEGLGDAPLEWQASLFEQIRIKFGDVGAKFTADRPVL